MGAKINNNEDPRGEPLVSIVIPIFNEEENIPELIKEIHESLANASWEWELILVDDGSTDSSAKTIRSLSKTYPRMSAVLQNINAGQSAAFRKGFEVARGEFVVTMDGDLQNDPADIPHLAAMTGASTAVCGIRANRHDTWLRRVSSRIANSIRGMVLHDGIIDTGCSMKVMPRDALLRIPYFKGCHRFYPALLQQQGVSIKQSPVNHRARKHGTSKYGVGNRAFVGFIDMLGVAWLQKRTKTVVALSPKSAAIASKVEGPIGEEHTGKLFPDESEPEAYVAR